MIHLQSLHLFAALMVTLSIMAALLVATSPVAALGPNLLPNWSFEDGEGAVIEGWSRRIFASDAIIAWDSSTAVHGTASAHFENPEAYDSLLTQELQLTPNSPHVFSGWIRTENVAKGDGAILTFLGPPHPNKTDGLYGTMDWTQVGTVFDSGPTGKITVVARLGNWGSNSVGSAWFDGLQVNLLDNTKLPDNTNWRIQLLLLDDVQAEIVDEAGKTRQVRSTIDEETKKIAFEFVQEFVNVDIPALSSGNMIPTLLPLVDTNKPVTTLTRWNSMYWPSPSDTVSLWDRTADSVIAVFNPRMVDIETGETIGVNYSKTSSYAGLAADIKGREQTYMTVIDNAATGAYGTRNTLRHEYGHCILNYFDEIGASPEPKVSNHASSDDYVNCETGAYYDFVDETLENPIPNSIYNIHEGFTHDYFSGTTALSSAPDQCLGITPEAWAQGGPVIEIPLPPLPEGSNDDSPAKDQLSMLTADLLDMVGEEVIDECYTRLPLIRLDMAARNIDDCEEEPTVLSNLQKFIDFVWELEELFLIHHEEANHLEAGAEEIIVTVEDGCDSHEDYYHHEDHYGSFSYDYHHDRDHDDHDGSFSYDYHHLIGHNA